jgi:two-component system sensor histidine kinase DesK
MMPLLPENKEQGWTRYAWIVYAVPFAVWPFWQGLQPEEWIWHGAGCAAFVALYFWVHWLEGLAILKAVAGFALLGLLYLGMNPNAIAFYIYAAAFSGYTKNVRAVTGTLAVLLVVMGGQSWWLKLPLSVTASGVVFSPLLAFLMLHFARKAELNAELQRAQEEVAHLARVAERERIARDLHDLLGHTLSAIVVKAALGAKLARRDQQRAEQEMKEVEEIARGALAEVRTAVQGYRTTGLRGELQRARALLENAGLEVTVEYGVDEMGRREEEVLVMVLKEAVTNVLRHSSARHCSLTVRREGRGIGMLVGDDGVGAGEEEGNGIAGMRARIAEVGGRFALEASAGTQVRVWVP